MHPQNKEVQDQKINSRQDKTQTCRPFTFESLLEIQISYAASIVQRRITRSDGVIESMKAGREKMRSPYVMIGAALRGNSMP